MMKETRRATLYRQTARHKRNRCNRQLNIWTGKRAISIGLVDRLGGMSDAMAAAAKLAKLKEYRNA